VPETRRIFAARRQKFSRVLFQIRLPVHCLWLGGKLVAARFRFFTRNAKKPGTPRNPTSLNREMVA
jgi:hypothetical protein